jgi:hypothetical protein
VTSLAAHVNKVTETHRITGEFANLDATAQGEFVVVNVTVTNRTHRPQMFWDYQAQLAVGGDTFSVSSKGQVADDRADSWGQDIEPGETGTGDLVYDVPAKQARAARHGTLEVVGFGAFPDTGAPTLRLPL